MFANYIKIDLLYGKTIVFLKLAKLGVTIMNAKKSKLSFKIFALVLAFAFTVLFIPVGELVAWAKIADEYTDYSFITIGDDGEEIKNTVYTGDIYPVPNAYIGGNKAYTIGDKSLATDTTLSGDAKYVSSKITVTYGTNQYSSAEDASENGVTIDLEAGGHFTADKIGTYVVTYSYTYKLGDGTKLTNQYEMKVESSISDASINLENNDGNLFPSIIDASLMKKVENTYEDIKLPIPTVYDEDGEEIENLILTTNIEEAKEYDNQSADEDKDCLLVTISGGADNEDLTEFLHAEASTEEGEVDTLRLEGSVFDKIGTNYSSYTIKYSYYHNGQFVVSTTKTAVVYKKHYENYNNNWNMELESSLTTSAQPGIEQTLPGVKVTLNDKAKPANEEIEVSYKIKVRYRAPGSSSYNDLDKALYNVEGEEAVVDEEGYLVDPTKFTPLEEGSYSFNYVAYDFYGNKVGETFDGRHEWENIKDTTTPEAIVYDASAKDENGELTYEEASDKLARYTYPNGVVIYAVGLEDNFTKVEDATLQRVVNANSETLFTIEDYDNYNLVFNYRPSSNGGTDAWQQLKNNNYLIRKAIDKYNKVEENTDVTDNITMLNWLKKNGYLIVIDNGGTSGDETNTYARSIYNSFATFFNEKGIENADDFVAYVKDSANKDTLTSWGFAYLDNEKTFGALSSNGGYNYSSYQIRYEATDKAGNSNYISRDMTLTTTYDSTAPTLSISTNFEDTYTSDAVVEFAVPTASDDNDTSARMKVQTYYRFLGANGDPIISEIRDEDDNIINTFDNTAIFDEKAEQPDRTDENGNVYVEKYDSYKGAGYINLTDADAENYKIDLAIGKAYNAQSVQIFAFVYDDYGNVGIIGDEFDISSAIDEYVPTLVKDSIEIDETQAEVNQGDDIELPTVTVRDDYVEFMDFNVTIYNEKEDGSKIFLTSPSNSKQTRNTFDYTYSVYGGTFTAAFAGDYVAAIELNDYNNGKVVVFTRYTAKSRLIIQDPVADVDFEDQTVELDDKPEIKLPTPTISYSIDNSLDYETYVKTKDLESFTEPGVVLIGVDENGYATDYETTYGQASSFKPTEKKTYTIDYTTRLRVYPTSAFEYVEGTKEDALAGKLVNYFTEKGEDAQDNYYIKPIDEKSYEVYTATDLSDPKTYAKYLVTEGEDGSVTTTHKTGTDGNVTIDQDRYEFWRNNLKMYVWNSENFTVTVNDTKGPKIKNYDYVESISYGALEEENGYPLLVEGIQATDASGINMKDSSVSVTTTYKSNGSTRTSVRNLNDEEKVSGVKIDVTLNGTITIAYSVKDNNGNTSTKEYTIKAGDNTDPIIKVNTADEEDFIATSYSLSHFQENDDLFTVNLKDLTFSDDRTDDQTKLTVEYKFVNEETAEEEIEAEIEDEDTIAYKITEVGTYTFSVTVTDEAGNYTTREFTFEVTEETHDPTFTYQVVGTILIVVSVLLLAGVIIYFIVSKVKLDKELKK